MMFINVLVVVVVVAVVVYLKINLTYFLPWLYFHYCSAVGLVGLFLEHLEESYFGRSS